MSATPSSFVGTPYAQMDCYALVRAVSADCFGVILPSVYDYLTNPDMCITQEKETGSWVPIQKDALLNGDIVTLSPVANKTAHVGIIIDDHYVLHNDKKYGCIIQTFDGLRRRGYLHVHGYRFKP